MRLVVGVSLVGAALLIVGCGDEDDAPRTAAKSAPAPGKGKDPKVVKGPFANAVQVGERTWMLTGDLTPPPVDRDDLTDDDEGEGGGSGGDGGNGANNRGGGGAKKKRFGQSPLYVDSKPVAVVAYGELPPWLVAREVTLGDGSKVQRFRLGEYFESVGVPLGKVQEVHLYGGRGRIAIIPGSEIRRVKKELLFSFTEGDSGKMRMHWGPKLEVSDTIDKVQAIAIYVDRKPPKWDRAKWGLVDDQGVEFEGIPYVGQPMKGGVRFYVDGRIAYHLKRNQTFGRKVEPYMTVDGVPYFRFFEYLKEMGADLSGVVAMELLSENTILRRIDRAELARERATLDISAPPGMSGQVLIHVGPEASRTSIPVTSVLLYTARRAAAHERR